MVAPFTRRCRVRVKWGEPIDLSDFQGKRVTQELLVEVTNVIFARLAELGGVGFAPAREHLEEERNELRNGNGNGNGKATAGNSETEKIETAD